MGLFSRKKDKTSIGLALEFNRQALQLSITKLAEDLHDYRNDPGHEVFYEYLQKLLNLEILTLAEAKTRDAETYSYYRGRIDALRHALNLRDKFILDQKTIRGADAKKGKTDHQSKRSYIRPPVTSAGMSD